MNVNDNPQTTNSLPTDRSGETADDRASLYWDLRELRDHDDQLGNIRCAIICYKNPLESLKIIGEWSGNQLYEAIQNQVLSGFSRGDWYRIGRTRIGFLSDEFESDSQFETFLDDFIDSFREPIDMGSFSITLDVDIGAIHGIEYPEDLDELLFEIEGSARLAGDTDWSSYRITDGTSPGSEDEFGSVDVTKELYSALDNDEFKLHYQPIVSMGDGSLEGVEALVRWDHPDHGLVMPGSFIPAVESSGLITFLGFWILERGIRDIARWSESDRTVSQVSINLSPKQFRDPNLAPKIEALLRKYGVQPKRLRLEITEQTMIRDQNKALGQLTSLIDLGVRVAMDDFGTGYSTLSELTHLPINVLKLDRSFIENDPPSEKERAVVDIIVNAGKSMDLDLLAEGIETVNQWDWLEDSYCDLAQGFYIAPALPNDVLMEWVDRLQPSTETDGQSPTFPDRALVEDHLPDWYE